MRLITDGCNVDRRRRKQKLGKTGPKQIKPRRIRKKSAVLN
jgi:hypothetical protein